VWAILREGSPAAETKGARITGCKFLETCSTGDKAWSTRMCQSKNLCTLLYQTPGEGLGGALSAIALHFAWERRERRVAVGEDRRACADCLPLQLLFTAFPPMVEFVDCCLFVILQIEAKEGPLEQSTTRVPTSGDASHEN
jgi:hypothetical protein